MVNNSCCLSLWDFYNWHKIKMCICIALLKGVDAMYDTRCVVMLSTINTYMEKKYNVKA